MTANTKPTKEQLSKLLDVMSQRQIADELGVCQKTVRNWKVSYGLESKRSAFFKRPERSQLIYSLRKRGQKGTAEHYGVSIKCVQKWRDHFNIRKLPKPRPEPNPMVYCACGCGKQFPKYLYGERAEGGTWKKARRFINGHSNRYNRERYEIQRAEIWARSEGERGQIEDVSDEYIGEAWLALAEGDDPRKRVHKQGVEDRRIRHQIDIDKVSDIYGNP